MAIRTLHIPVTVDEAIRIIDVPDETAADDIHELVEGWFQVVRLENDILMWLNDEGKVHSLPWNPRGQALWDSCYGASSDLIVGPVALTNGFDDAGETRGLTDEQLALIEQRLTTAFGPVVRVRIENSYSDGHKSNSEVLLASPSDVEDEDSLEDWWNDEVFEHTGDGHDVDGELSCVYTATVLAGPASLVGQSTEWLD